MPKSPECAYCGRIAPFTKEHLWPTCIINRVQTYDMRYSERAQKVVAGDLTVGDVCARCNNGPLSQLDAYIGRLYDAHFATFAEYRTEVEFCYDYDLLLRWLLKMSYNSARVSGRDAAALKTFVPYILGDGQRPTNVGVQLQLVGPSYIAKEQPDSAILVPKKIQPKSVRCGWYGIPGHTFDWIVLRAVTLNSYYFFLLILPDPSRDVPLHELKTVDANVPGELIEPGSSVMAIVPSGPDAASLMLPHFQSKREAYASFLRDKQRK